MPSLGADMEWGILSEWYVTPGDRVERGDIVGVVETRKGSIEVEIFESGVVEELVVEEGTKVPVGEVLARIRVEQEAEVTKPGAERETEPTGPEEAPEVVPSKASPPREGNEVGAVRPEPRGEADRGLRASPAARRRAEEMGVDLGRVRGTGADGAVTLADVEAHAGGRRLVTPLARRRAEELDVNLDSVEGSGPGGRITRGDVEAHAGRAAEEAPSREKAPGSEEAAGLRDAIARSMARSKREIPHFYLGTRIDMGPALEWIEGENRGRSASERVLPAALLLKATALALREVPELNGFWRDGELQVADRIHVGVGISLRGGGLLAPAMHDVDRQAVGDLSRELVDLVNRARSGRLRSSEVTDATITVTNLGERGVETVYGIIYPPQVALVGFGTITERPWARDGMLAARPVVEATLSADHRATDGHRGGLFLQELEHRLRRPEEL